MYDTKEYREEWIEVQRRGKLIELERGKQSKMDNERDTDEYCEWNRETQKETQGEREREREAEEVCVREISRGSVFMRERERERESQREIDRSVDKYGDVEKESLLTWAKM